MSEYQRNLWRTRLQEKTLRPEILEMFEERAAIIEFDGKLNREEAEELALEIVYDSLTVL